MQLNKQPFPSLGNIVRGLATALSTLGSFFLFAGWVANLQREFDVAVIGTGWVIAFVAFMIAWFAYGFVCAACAVIEHEGEKPPFDRFSPRLGTIKAIIDTGLFVLSITTLLEMLPYWISTSQADLLSPYLVAFGSICLAARVTNLTVLHGRWESARNTIHV